MVQTDQPSLVPLSHPQLTHFFQNWTSDCPMQRIDSLTTTRPAGSEKAEKYEDEGGCGPGSCGRDRVAQLAARVWVKSCVGVWRQLERWQTLDGWSAPDVVPGAGMCSSRARPVPPAYWRHRGELGRWTTGTHATSVTSSLEPPRLSSFVSPSPNQPSLPLSRNTSATHTHFSPTFTFQLIFPQFQDSRVPRERYRENR